MSLPPDPYRATLIAFRQETGAAPVDATLANAAQVVADARALLVVAGRNDPATDATLAASGTAINSKIQPN